MAKKVIGDALRRGEEIFQSVSGRLLEQPAVAKAFEAALVGKSKVDEGLATAIKRLNLQTRSEFRGLKARVDGLEMQIAELRETVARLSAPPAPKPRPRAKARKAGPKA